MTDKTELEICEAATPGPWKIRQTRDMCDEYIAYLEPIGLHLHDGLEEGDYEFLEHFNPRRVKELLTEIDRLQSENAALKAVGYPVCKAHSVRDYTENRPDCPFCLQVRTDDAMGLEPRSVLSVVREVIETGYAGGWVRANELEAALKESPDE